MKKHIYMGTNTKMYKNIVQTVRYLKRFDAATQHISREYLTLFVIPSYTSLLSARFCVSREKILIGAQNMCWEEEGQFTGEISPLMLQEVGVDLVEIGHSERRNIFGETDDQVRLKVKAAVEHGFTALLCVGETVQEKHAGFTHKVLRRQLEIGLQNMSRSQAGQIWVAYEPTWAIGVNGKPVAPEYVAEQHDVIRHVLMDCLGAEAGAIIPVLYGGGVNLKNALSLIQLDHVDGLFVGRAAWHADAFASMIELVLQSVFEKEI